MSTIRSYEKSGQGSVEITIDISFSSMISSEREGAKTEKLLFDSMQG